MPDEDLAVTLARVEQRVIAVERDVRDLKSARPSWPVIISSLAALGALVITIIQL